MVPSFDSSSMTLAQAADFVAMQAEVGSARSGREKQAMGHPLAGALIGGGLGAGAGMLSSMGDDEESQRNWWRNALMGGALGAGVGGAAGAGYDLMGAASGVDPEVAARDAAIKARAGTSATVNDPVGSALGKAYSWLTQNSPPLTPADEAFYKSKGIDPTDRATSLVPDKLDAAGEYLGRLPTVGASGMAGAGLGHIVDRARAPGAVGTLNESQIKTLSGTGGAEATKIQNLLKTPHTELYSSGVTPPSVRATNQPKWLKTPPPSLHTMSPHLLGEMKSKFAPRTGKAIGAAGGALLAPFFARMFRD